MTSLDLDAIVAAVLIGDIDKLWILQSVQHEELSSAFSDRALVVTHGAVARVIRGYAAGRIPMASAQLWAAFVRNGYIPAPEGRRSGIYPLHIEYEAAYDEEIAVAVSRVDELGDLIDGEISPSEAEELLRSLADRV